MFIAHRGLVTNQVQENSYKALKNALDSDKYIGIECDVRKSKDNQLVLNHDPIINNKLVSQTPYKELKKLGIITLDKLLSIKTNKILLIEIKDTTIDHTKLTKLLNNKKNIYVMSFYKSYIKKLSNQSRTYKVGYLNYVLNSDKDNADFDFVCLLKNTVTKRLISYFKNNDIEIFIYGVLNLTNLINNIPYIVDDKIFNE